jgi:hypothetical protein
MNRALPPRDRGNRSSNARWASGCPRTLPGTGRLVGRTALNRKVQDRRRRHVDKRGGFARFWRETPRAMALSARKLGEAAVCS